MPEAAIDIIRRLWGGHEVTVRGEHFTVENARIYAPPSSPIPVIVSAFGPVAARMAARAGDGLWTGADAEVIEAWRHAGGEGSVYSQISLYWAPTRDEAVDLAHRVWPNTGVPGQLRHDLSTPALRPGGVARDQGDDRRLGRLLARHRGDHRRRSAGPLPRASTMSTSTRSATTRRASARWGVGKKRVT